MRKKEWMFLAGFLYLALLCTLALEYWLGGSKNIVLVTVNYALIVIAGLLFGSWGMRHHFGGERRRRAKTIACKAVAVLIVVSCLALSAHTVSLWLLFVRGGAR